MRHVLQANAEAEAEVEAEAEAAAEAAAAAEVGAEAEAETVAEAKVMAEAELGRRDVMNNVTISMLSKIKWCEALSFDIAPGTPFGQLWVFSRLTFVSLQKLIF